MSADLLAEFKLHNLRDDAANSERPNSGSQSSNRGHPNRTSENEHISLDSSQPFDSVTKAQNVSKGCKEPHSDILFDALEEISDADDFGDFEQGQSQESGASQLLNRACTSPSNLCLDLLILDDPIVDARTRRTGPEDTPENVLRKWLPENAKSDQDDWSNFEQAHGSNQIHSVLGKPNVLSDETVAKSDPFDTDWADFDEIDLPTVSAKKEEEHLTASLRIETNPTQPTIATNTTLKSPTGVERPSNVPPPSILLQILPHVFGSLCKETARNTQHAQEIADALLQAHIVASRIIAGRSVRWRRDVLLSQSMKIGMAGKKSGGMKLASLDKTEAVREDQEAAEVAASWTRSSYRFNSILARAGIRRQQLSMSLKTLPKQVRSSAILTAVQPCALCGLRRDERLPGVDNDAHDSFGEYWAEHWGHRSCSDFWAIHSSRLQQR